MQESKAYMKVKVLQIWEYYLTIEVLDQPTNATSAVHHDDVSTDAYAFSHHSSSSVKVINRGRP